MGKGSARVVLGVFLALVAAGCTNNPYPGADADRKLLYRTMAGSAPKTLDPAVAYSVVDHMVTGTVYDTLVATAEELDCARCFVRICFDRQ